MTTATLTKLPRAAARIPLFAPVAKALNSGLYVVFSGTIAETVTSPAEIFEVPINTFVSEVKVLILTAMDGGSATLTIGDGDDADGYLTSANIAPGTIKAGYVSSHKSDQPYAGGKLYTARDTIDCTIVEDSGTLGTFIFACVFRPWGDRNSFV